jgi:G patch domain-containing protein 1
LCLGFRDTNASLIDVLKSVIKPTVESIGVKLFKQMKRNVRNDSNYSESKVYGCEKPSNKSLNSELPFCLYKPKSDFHGIGYKGIDSENNSYDSKSSSGVSAVLSSGRKLKISGEAFGYGVLEEDNEEEDAVVYHKDDMSQYDFAIGTVREKVNDRKTDRHKAIEFGKTDIIEGFVKCFTKTNLMEIIIQKYPIPVLPPNWRPSSYSGVTKLKKSRSRWDQTNSQSSNTDNNTTVPSKAPVLNANIRAVLLGEEIIHRQGVKPIEKVEPIDDSMISPKVSSIENKSIAQKPLTGFWANKFTRSDKIEENTLTGGLTEFNSKQSDNREKLEEPQNDTNKTIERTIYEWHPHNLLCKRFNIPNPYPQYPDVVGIVTVGKTDVRNRTSQMTAKKNKPNIFECLFQNVSIEPKPNEVVQDLNSQKEINKTDTTIDSSNHIRDEEIVETTRPPMDLFKAIFASDEEESDNEINKEENIVINSESEKLVEKNTTNTSQMSGTKATGIFANIDFDQLNRNFTPLLKSNDTQKVETNDSQKVETNDSQKVKTFSEINENTDKTNQNDDDFYGPALPPPSSSSTVTNFNINNNSSELQTKSLKRKKKEKKQRKHKKKSSSHKKHKRHRRSSSSSSSDENLDLKILGYLKK